MGEMKTEPRILGTILGTKTRNEDISRTKAALGEKHPIPFCTSWRIELRCREKLAQGLRNSNVPAGIRMQMS